jgi:hypothetical protein
MDENFSNNNYWNQITPGSDGYASNANYIKYDNELFQNDSQKKLNNKFTIISITPIKTTINKTLNMYTNYDDEIFIFEIKGKTKSNSEMLWKIYINHREIKDLFENIRKELTNKNISSKYILNACKIVKDYKNEEIADNIKTISTYIMNFYNSEEGNKLEILNEALKISATSFVNN